MKTYVFLVLLINLLFTSMSFANEYADDRRKMKIMLTQIVKDLNDGSLNNFDQYLSKEAVVTFYDGEYATGIPAIKKCMEKMLTGDNPVLKSIRTTAKETEEAKVYPNNTAIAYGQIANDLVFINGKSMHIDGRWTTSLIKQDEQWKITSLHFSANLFDNAILNEAKERLLMFCSIALIIGFILGWILKKHKKSL